MRPGGGLFGTEGIAAGIRSQVGLARDLAGWIDRNPKVERLAEVPFSVVCFRVHPPGTDDEAALETLNSAVLEKVNTDGGAFPSHTKLKGRYALRVAIGNLQTTAEHVRRAHELVCRAAGIPA